jgi:REP element-mobilizing transposase RayT
LFIFIVFSTKERRPFLRDCKLRESVHAYLGAISKRLDCAPIMVGGVADHVHLLARFGRTITQAEWVKELKRVSNEWIQKEGIVDFQWQAGYADFSVSRSNLQQVQAYIAGQEEHHKRISFQDELRALLRKNQMEWDERYLWD